MPDQVPNPPLPILPHFKFLPLLSILVMAILLLFLVKAVSDRQQRLSTSSRASEEFQEGILLADIQDDFNNNKSQTSYYLQTETKISKLTDFVLPGSIKPGAKIKIKHDRSVELLEQSTSLSPQATSGVKRAAIIKINFANTSENTPLDSRIQRAMVDVGRFYRENSYGKLNFSTSRSDIYGWYTLDINPTCDLVDIVTHAIAASDPDINFRRYSNLVIIYPGISCGFAGTASIGEWLNIYTADGYVNLGLVIINNNLFDANSVSHELGHNLTAFHGNRLNCESYSLVKNCASLEYYDPYDVMGTNLGHFSAYHKELFGWQPNIITPTASGDYTIYALERSPERLQALKIPVDSNNYIYVEKRERFGFDSRFDDNVISGVLIRFNPQIIGEGDSHIANTYYFDSQFDPRLSVNLKPGESAIYDFTDGRKLAITTLESGNDYAKVNVDFDPYPVLPKNITIIDNLDTSGSVETQLQGYPKQLIQSKSIPTNPPSFYGPNYWLIPKPANPSANAFVKFNTKSLAKGSYEVSVRWAVSPQNASNAKVTITPTGGQPEVVKLVNQKKEGRVWKLLGVFTLDNTSRVTISTEGADGDVSIDAVRFIKKG